MSAASRRENDKKLQKNSENSKNPYKISKTITSRSAKRTGGIHVASLQHNYLRLFVRNYKGNHVATLQDDYPPFC